MSENVMRNPSSVFINLFSQFNLLNNYALHCCHEQLGWYGVPLSYSYLDPGFLTIFVYTRGGSCQHGLIVAMCGCRV